MRAGVNGNYLWEWEGNGHKTRLNLGLRMGMKINHWEWEGMGLKKIFPLISTASLPVCATQLSRVINLLKLGLG